MTTNELTTPLFCLVQEGVGLLLGTVGLDGSPRGTRAWGIRIVEDRLRVTFGADDPQVVANARDGVVAVTGADVRRLRSAQVKGTVVRLVEADAEDMAAVEEQSELFFQAIHETDLDEIDVLRRMLPARMMALEMSVAEVYDQTPGPRAGLMITASTVEDG